MAEQLPDLSRAAAARLIKGHLILLNDRPAEPATRVAKGDVVDVELPEAFVTEVTGELIPLEIVHEDDDLVVVNKPAGMVVHPAPGNPEGTLVNALLAQIGRASCRERV